MPPGLSREVRPAIEIRSSSCAIRSSYWCAPPLPFHAGVPYLTEPSLCPTRPEIAFVSGGDIWVAPAKGGEAHLLVSHPADESRPLYSPDGTRLAFVSTRTGNGDIYVLTLATGELKRLTFDDGLDQLDAWSRDGKWIYFSNGTHDVGRKNDHLPRERRGRHAHAGQRRPLHQRVSGRPVARRLHHGFRRARQRRSAVVAPRPQPPGRIRNLAAQRRRRRLRTPRRPQRPQRLAHVDARRPPALLHVGPRRRAEHLVPRARARSRGRSPNSPTAASSGPPSATTANPSSSSATSRSGSSIPKAARLTPLPITLVGSAAGPAIHASHPDTVHRSRPSRPTRARSPLIAHGESFVASGATRAGRPSA